MIDGWPLYYAQELVVGNPQSNVAICTLWTDRAKIAQELSLKSYAVCGNLYSLWGINYILRNVLANPHIRYLILCGADRSLSGDGLRRLFTQGLNSQHGIIGSQATIEREIPLEAIELFRASVQLIDMTGERDGASIRKAVEPLAALPPFAQPLVFTESTPQAQMLPSEGTGFQVAQETVAQAWLRLLKLVMSFGLAKPSEYSAEQKELLNLVAVISAEYPERPKLESWLPFGREELERYATQVVWPEYEGVQLSLGGGPQGEVSYTYSDRLRNFRSHAVDEFGRYPAIDQVAAMIERLRHSPHSRRAMAITWDPFVDDNSPHPPCLIDIMASVQGGMLYLTAHFRSHDIFGAWPQNAYALRKLQAQIAANVGVALGPLTIVSHSAHIYSDKWNATQELLEKYYPQRLAWKDDPRGNFHISVEKGRIVAEHATTQGGKTGIVFEGKSARALYGEIINHQMISLPEHAAYLGMELYKAEIALRTGAEYHQDKDLKLPVPEALKAPRLNDRKG